MNETDKGPDVCQNQNEGLNETQGAPDGSRELSDSSHELPDGSHEPPNISPDPPDTSNKLPDGMEIDMSHYKEGSAAAKCVLGVILLLCFIFMSRSCNSRHSTLTFYMGPEPEVNLGSQYYEEGRYQEAADYYQEKVDEVFSNGKRYEPANGPLYFNLGMAYYKLENYDQALLYLKECADVDKRTSNTEELAWDYNTMADVYKDAGHMDEALNYYEKGLKAIKKACGKDSEYTAIFLSDLGDAYKKTEDYEKALENYQQALKIQESNGSDQTWSYIRIARIYNALKDYDAAEHFYGKASGSETADSYTKGVAFYNMGQMYHERGEYSPALAALHKALEFVNQDGDNAYAESNVQNTLASVYAESEDSLDKAIVHSVTACRLLETSGFPTHNCREDLEQFKEQLKGYYQTDTRDMTDEGFELWYQGQMDSE